MKAGWDAFVEGLGLGEVMSVSMFVICVCALCLRCCLAVYWGAREKRIVHASAAPTRARYASRALPETRQYNTVNTTQTRI